MISVVTAALVMACPQEPAEPVAAYELVNAFPGQEKFEKPLLLEHNLADPDVYYVAEQDGVIYRIPRDGALGDRAVFLDWRARTHTANWEEGLLGFAFAPDHADSGEVFIYYSQRVEEGGRQSVISRLGTTDDEGLRADGDSELVVMTVPQPYGNHNGGTILFGPDEMLYVVLGDGGAANDPRDHGQNLGTLLGSVLRIDVREATAAAPYTIPSDNPFVGRDDARPEIWAYGLRNLWRITFDRQTGELWGADVGQNKWEEVNRIVRGGNYGWNLMEGTHDFKPPKAGAEVPDDLIAPVTEYSHQLGLSVTGGYVYRGERIPELVGRYVYGDFVTGRVWAVAARDGGAADVVELCKAPATISSFAEEPNGELLLLSFDGNIYRLAKRRS